MGLNDLVDVNSTVQSASDLKTAQGLIDYYNQYTILLNDVLAIFNVGSKTKNTITSAVNSLQNPAGKFFGKIGGGIATSVIDLPIPMIGFQYQAQNLDLLNFQYSDNPYLNRAQLTSGVVQKSGSITIKLIKPITNINSILVNTIANNLTIDLLEQYVQRGGTFTLFTPWKNIGPLALEKLSGVNESTAGSVFSATFKKLNFVEATGASTLSSAFSTISRGGVA